MKAEINDILFDFQASKICIGEASNRLEAYAKERIAGEFGGFMLERRENIEGLIELKDNHKANSIEWFRYNAIIDTEWNVVKHLEARIKELKQK